MNNISDIELFELLKKEVSQAFLSSNSAFTDEISEWKGQDIVNFQEDILLKTKSTVSEKWFYTYFKSEFKKLPRIDMLNLLSLYAGYSGWAEFVHKQNKLKEENRITEKEPEETKEDSEEVPPKPVITEKTDIPESIEEIKPPSTAKKSKNLWIYGILGLLLLGAAGAAAYYNFFYQKTYEFCFIDADRNTPIAEDIEITIARKGFTPLELLTQNGCVEFPSLEDTLLMSIKSTYYKQDTFKINLHLYQGRENIRLVPDDYKVMLHHYSKSSQSVKERIKMLDSMIADDALIYQVYDNEFFGVEVLTKKQYINLVSLPTTSLKNFTLIEAERKQGKIVKIKFKIQSDEN